MKDFASRCISLPSEEQPSSRIGLSQSWNIFRTVAVVVDELVLLACRVVVVVVVSRCFSIGLDRLVVVDDGWREKPLLLETSRVSARIQTTAVAGMVRRSTMVESDAVEVCVCVCVCVCVHCKVPGDRSRPP